MPAAVPAEASGAAASCPAQSGSKLPYSKGHRAAICGLLLAAAALAFAARSACAQTGDKHLVVIVVPGLRADDLARPELANLRVIVETGGAIGWMNTRTARVPGQTRDPEEAAYLTLGAGARATAGPYADVVTPAALARLRRENARLDHSVPIGALGDLLHAAGRLVTLYGSQDDNVPRREALLTAMGSDGHVDTDYTIPKYWRAPSATAPYGFVQSGVAELDIPGDSVSVFGDLARATRYEDLCLPSVAARDRSDALARLDTCVAGLGGGSGDYRFILLAPCPADSAEPGDRLAPIVMWGDGVKPGLLTSGSTQTPGLVANTDFLPTVAAYFGLKPPAGTVGRPITVVPLAHSPTLVERLLASLLGQRTPNTQHPTPELWAGLHDRWMTQSHQQAALGGLPGLQALAVALGTALLLMQSAKCKVQNARWSEDERPDGPPPNTEHRTPNTGTPTTQRPHEPPPNTEHRTPNTEHSHAARAIAVAVAALPLALFVLPQVSPAPVWAAGLLLAAVIAAVAGAAWRWPERAAAIAVGAMAVLLILAALDLVAGSQMMRRAWMSYSVMEGARYYGVGNEYEGAMVGAMFVTAAALLRGGGVRRWHWVLAALLTVTAVIGWPSFGAKAGGVLGTVVACVTAGAVWRRGRLQGRDIARAAAAAVLALGAFAAYDLTRPAAARSHVGHAVSGGAAGFAGVANIAARKLALNGWLLVHSPWALALTAAAGALWALWRFVPTLHEQLTADRGLRGAATGLLVGAAALFVVNDSGVVAAAETLLMGWAGAVLVASPTARAAQGGRSARRARRVPDSAGASPAPVQSH